MKKIILIIDGMQCGMCEAHINDTIRKNFTVKKVKSSRRRRETVITTENGLDIAAVKTAIENIGYTVVSIKSE